MVCLCWIGRYYDHVSNCSNDIEAFETISSILSFHYINGLETIVEGEGQTYSVNNRDSDRHQNHQDPGLGRVLLEQDPRDP